MIFFPVYGLGGPEGMDLQGFDDAMLDASTGLTHVALTERVNSLSEMLKECFHS